MTDNYQKTIAERLLALGYSYERDGLTATDGRMSICPSGDPAKYAVDRMSAQEAAEFCGRHEQATT